MLCCWPCLIDVNQQRGLGKVHSQVLLTPHHRTTVWKSWHLFSSVKKKIIIILQKRVRWASAAFLMLSEVCNCFQLLRDLPYKRNVSQLYQEHLWKTRILLDTEPWKLSNHLITSLPIWWLLSTSNISVGAASPPNCSFLALSLVVWKAAAGLSLCGVPAAMVTNSKLQEHKSESSWWNVSQGYHGPVLGIKHTIKTADNCPDDSWMWSLKLISCCFCRAAWARNTLMHLI